jgi:CubicO group peptidase (beta-lactamase class C family)
MQLDNPAVLGPAGTVHWSLADWGRFVGLHLQGARGQGTLLKPETFRFLHSPPKDGDYTCGWGVVQRPWAGGRALTHAGSNTMWYAVVWIAPEKNFAILAVVNMGGDAAAKACDAAVSALILRRQKSD